VGEQELSPNIVVERIEILCDLPTTQIETGAQLADDSERTLEM
jgi:hypothetical protein